MSAAEPPVDNTPPPPTDGLTPPPEDLCASGSFAGGDCKFLINIRCADWRDQADSWNKAKQMEYLYKCMAQDCVQSLEPVDSNREAQTADGIPETPGCRYLDDSPGSGFCYAYNAAQMWCKENPDSEVCQNDPWSSAAARAPLGSEASRQTAWQPGTFPLRGSSASLGTVSCACMKQCACTVGWNKWECRCVDENQEPVGPGSAVPTKIVQDGRKKDECACLCTENGDGGRRRLLSEAASVPTKSRKRLLSESLLKKPTKVPSGSAIRKVYSPRRTLKPSYSRTRRARRLLSTSDDDVVASFSVCIADMTRPRLISFAPNQGPALGGGFFLLAFTGGGAYMNNICGNVNFVDPEWIFIMPASEWGDTASTTYQEVLQLTGQMSQVSEELSTQYASVISQALAEQAAGLESYIVAMNMPMQYSSGRMVAVISACDGSSDEVTFEFMACDPASEQTATALITGSQASGNVDGGNVLAIELHGFGIIYDVTRLTVTFGGIEAEIRRLIHSTCESTRIAVLVPAGRPGHVQCMVTFESLSGVVYETGSGFGFIFLDDKVPYARHYSPSAVYSDGGYDVMVEILDLPQAWSSTGIEIKISFSNGMEATVDFWGLRDYGERWFTLWFSSPEAPDGGHGMAWVTIYVSGRTARSFSLVYYQVPTSAPDVTFQSPASGVGYCRGEGTVSLVLTNMKKVDDPNDINVMFGDMYLDAETVQVLSSFERTIVSFSMPEVDNIGSVTVEVSSAADFSVPPGSAHFTCQDYTVTEINSVSPAYTCAGGDSFTRVVVSGLYRGAVFNLKSFYSFDWGEVRVESGGPVTVVLEAQNIITSMEILGASYKVYTEFTYSYQGCVGSSCGIEVASWTGATGTVPANAFYLFVVTHQQYDTQYFIQYVSASGLTFSFLMLPKMSAGQTRVVLSWEEGEDLDVWAYSPDKTKAVGWHPDPAGRTGIIAGGAVSLDRDTISGPEGPETTQVQNMISGTVEIWINHYDEKFPADQDTSASVSVYCFRCRDDSDQVKEGLVAQVQQRATGIPDGGANWWKVGEFTATTGVDVRVKWTTCVSNCYTNAGRGGSGGLAAPATRVARAPQKPHALSLRSRAPADRVNDAQKNAQLRSSHSSVGTIEPGPVELFFLMRSADSQMLKVEIPLCSEVDVSMTAKDMVSGTELTDVTYTFYSGYPAPFVGCSGSFCGNRIATSSAASYVVSVPADDHYLIVARLNGYYDAYYEVYADAGGSSVNIEMVQSMATNQDRVVLSWDFTDDLDLWVYDKADRSNSVGWSGKTDSFAGGTITLDVDVMEGPGVETTQFMNLASGSVEVWVNHYSGQFTQDLVSDTPATVDIFCYRCTDDNNQVKVGYVTSVTQNPATIPSGGRNWWKVGEFTAPGVSERVKWTTCTTDCYLEGGQGNIEGRRRSAAPAKTTVAETHKARSPRRPSVSNKNRMRTASGGCPSQLSFSFNFIDCSVPRVDAFEPTSEYLFGGTDMVAHVYKLPADLDHSNVKVDFGGHSVIASEIVYQSEDWANVVVSIPLSMSSHRVIPQLSACSCRDDPDWMETNSETVDNDQGGQTTTTWNTKCEWVASNLDNLGQLCHTPMYGYAAVETVREKCPAACSVCSDCTTLEFPSVFTYLEPPSVVCRVAPAQASTAFQSQLKLTVHNFPGVTNLMQLSAKFTYASGEVISASVESFVQLDDSLPSEMMQSLEVRVFTPQGSRVVAGDCMLSLTHAQYPSSIANAPFMFTDPAVPRVVKISRHGETGASSLRVGASLPSDVTIEIADSDVWESGVVLVDGIAMLLEQISYSGASRKTTLSFATPTRDSVGLVYGLAVFGEPIETCSSSCCSDQSCADSCPDLKTACFSLDYYNDAETFLTFSSDLRGPAFGGGLCPADNTQSARDGI